MDFDFKSSRAKLARFAKTFGKFLEIASAILVIILIISAVFLFISGEKISWLLLGFASWPAMIYLWKINFLAVLPAKKSRSSSRIDEVLAGDILGEITSANPSPRELAVSVMKTNGGRFFAARFGISAQYLPELSSENPTDSAAIWQKVREIHGQIEHLENLGGSRKTSPAKSDTTADALSPNSRIISAAELTAAIIMTQSSMQQILSALHLDNDDIFAGARWFSHLQSLIEIHNVPKLTGGVARDWSFGYIPTLERFGTNLSAQFGKNRSLNTRLETHENLVAQMLQNLGGGGRANVALIGKTGSGKSTVVENFAEKLMNGSEKVPEKLRFNQVFALDAGSLISAASGRGQIESLVNLLLVEAFRAKNIILFLDNAQLFFEDATGSVDISNILQPILEGGNLKMILALDEQKFLQISQAKPALASVLNRLQVASPPRDEVLKILEDQVISLEYSRKVTFMYQSLTESYRLSERYLQDVAQPGKAVQLLTSAANFADNSLVTAKSVQDAIEKTLGVKVGGGAQNDAAEREKLLNLENLIHERMINQVAAVNAVASALRRARAGVRSENRPIGTFLFLGPTGVGKTELAKSLAAVYFGGEDHLARIDLNEYVQAEDVSRLIADGAQNPNSLAAQVQKNPFAVVLLDEIEKAHPNVLATLLQVLDEGILRDINGREISFRDTILIATSNAGAERIRQYIDAGYQVEQFAEQFQNELIESRSFAPEFLNRFDEIIVFRPLTKTELLQVVDLLLAGINKTLSLQKVAVAVDDDAKKALVDAGYDPRLGARPMRRVVQKTVEDIVAKKLLTGELVAGSGMLITLNDVKNVLGK